MSENIKAIVIGAGFGGIATAIRLQAAGFKTTLIEGRDKPGGRAYRYEDQGFKFDAGPTVITAQPSIEELFELGQKNISDYVTMIPVQPFYRLFWESGETFDYTNNETILKSEIEKLSPADWQGYCKFVDYAQKVFDVGYTELCHVPFLKFSDMVKVSPQLIKLQAYRSVYSKVSEYIKHPLLRQAFSFNSLLIGGNPFRASSIYTLIHPLEKKWGVSFPKGGTFALIEGLLKYFGELGGTLRLGEKVTEILTDQKNKPTVTGVTTKNTAGQTFKISCDAIVSNADVVHTHQTLLRKVPAAGKASAKLKKMRHSMSLFVYYFGTNKKYPNLVHHNVLFGNRYRELIEDIFTRKILADDFSLYLHAPCASDPSLAPPGCDAFYVLSPVPNLKGFEQNWEEIKFKYRDKIVSYLEKNLMPGLKDSIVTDRIFTPNDFKNELNAFEGSAFSLEPTLLQSAYWRVHNRSAEISGLYFCGAGTHPGAGIPGVIGSAKATSGLVIDDFLIQDSRKNAATTHNREGTNVHPE